MCCFEVFVLDDYCGSYATPKLRYDVTESKHTNLRVTILMESGSCLLNTLQQKYLDIYIYIYIRI